MTSTAAPACDGALVIDKPSGPSSHDIVAAVRRALAGVKVGHTGTLDPLATGVLPLLVGRATRLARFLASATKTYTAHVQFGWGTDTYDSAGEPTGPPTPAAVDRGALETVLGGFHGSFLQQPPAYSAKKVGGHRAYALARASQVVALEPVMVTVHDLRLLELDGGTATIEVTSSAGFYVRSLAHDLGVALGTPAHLAGLRRTRSGEFDLTQAVPFGVALEAPGTALNRMVPTGALLRHLKGCRLTVEGVRLVCHGRDVEPRLLLDAPLPPGTAESPVRLLDEAGALVALGVVRESSGALHPVVVLR
jgi:tRNA pseudouridine55 synthase